MRAQGAQRRDAGRKNAHGATARRPRGGQGAGPWHPGRRTGGAKKGARQGVEGGQHERGRGAASGQPEEGRPGLSAKSRADRTRASAEPTGGGRTRTGASVTRRAPRRRTGPAPDADTRPDGRAAGSGRVEAGARQAGRARARGRGWLRVCRVCYLSVCCADLKPSGFCVGMRHSCVYVFYLFIFMSLYISGTFLYPASVICVVFLSMFSFSDVWFSLFIFLGRKKKGGG